MYPPLPNPMSSPSGPSGWPQAVGGGPRGSTRRDNRRTNSEHCTTFGFIRCCIFLVFTGVGAICYAGEMHAFIRYTTVRMSRCLDLFDFISCLVKLWRHYGSTNLLQQLTVQWPISFKFKFKFKLINLKAIHCRQIFLLNIHVFYIDVTFAVKHLCLQLSTFGYRSVSEMLLWQ